MMQLLVTADKHRLDVTYFIIYIFQQPWQHSTGTTSTPPLAAPLVLVWRPGPDATVCMWILRCKMCEGEVESAGKVDSTRILECIKIRKQERKSLKKLWLQSSVWSQMLPNGKVNWFRGFEKIVEVRFNTICVYDITMQTQLKRYSIILRGRVQHIGYRGMIEGTARKLDLKGYIFNDIDNSVKIVVEGLQKSVDNFLNAINDFARVDIESIEQKEIHEIFPIPHLFSRVVTDEYYEFGQKFDIGLDYLDGIKTDTGDIKSTLGDMKGSLSSIDSTLGTFVGEQREHNQWMKKHIQRMDDHNQSMKEHNQRIDEHNQRMDEHNHRLDKILTKLAEK